MDLSVRVNLSTILYCLRERKGIKDSYLLQITTVLCKLVLAKMAVLCEQSDLQSVLVEKEKKFYQACAQVRLLNTRLGELEVRCEKAQRARQLSFLYNHRLRMTTMEGVRNTYYEYACRKAQEILKVRHFLLEEREDLE